MNKIITKNYVEKHVVYFFESERGWGSDSWEVFYDSKEKAEDAVINCNKSNPTDHVPDYYIVATYKGTRLVEI